MRLGLGVFGALLFLATGAWAENWPHWRGPTRDGISLEMNLPTTWSSTEGIIWKLPMLAWSGSTPDPSYVLGIDALTGSTRWRVGPDVPTPVADDKHLYVLRDNGVIFCLEVKTERSLIRSSGTV